MGFLSKVTVSAVGLGSKALLNLGFCSSVTVNGLDNLLNALEDQERDRGRGIVTSTSVSLYDASARPQTFCTSVSNHIST